MRNTLYRDENRKILGGVCAGLADYFNMDIGLMRVIFVLGWIFAGLSFWVYIILWIVIPAKFTINPGVDYTIPTPDGPTVPARSTVTGTMVVGLVLIFFGALFLMKEYDILPYFEYHKLWPLVFVVLGLAIIFGAGKSREIPNQFENWHKAQGEQKENKDTNETI